MVGQRVLRECLLHSGVESVLTVGRRAGRPSHQKLRAIVTDLTDLSPVAAELTGYDACFFCLGVSSAGMTEQDYRRVTYDIAMAAAQMFYAAVGPLYPLLKAILPKYITTSDQIGRAMVAVAAMAPRSRCWRTTASTPLPRPEYRLRAQARWRDGLFRSLLKDLMHESDRDRSLADR
jgi:hypothetical protein